MRIEWTDEFDRWLARIEDRAERGDDHANRQLDYVAAELGLLRDLERALQRDDETAQLKWVRQRGRHEIWRVSHRFDEAVAIRLIVWFPPDEDTVVVTAFGGTRSGSGMCSTAALALAPTPQSTGGCCTGRTNVRAATTRIRVMAMPKSRKTPKGFVDGTTRVDRLLSDPERAKRVAQIRADGREMDRVHAINLATIRKAAEMTQEEVAERLGGRQGDVSRIENRDDLLLSTLLNYLTATGAEDARIVVTVRGQEFELDLARIALKAGDAP